MTHAVEMNSVSEKPVVLYGVAVMESSPQRDRAAPIRLYDIEGNLDSLDIHHTNTPMMAYTDHEQLQSPLESVAPTTKSTQKGKYRVLGTLSLTGIVYFATCGGPVGSEPLVSAGGPLVGLLAVLAFALLVQFPLSWMVTELCCAFPENGGYSVWALTAFGPFWGFQVGYWSWVSAVLNNAIYPGLIYTTIMEGYGIQATSSVVAFVVKVAIACVLAIPSYIGVRFVGIGALVLLIVVGLTTMLFTVWGFADGDGAWFRLTEVRGDAANSTADGIDWVLLIRALVWSFDGLYDISVIGGEVINPARTFPRVIMLAVLLALATYLFPWISAITADKMPWRQFTEDSFPDVAQAIGGSFLRQVVLGSSVLSSIAMFSSTLFFQSYLVQGMAQSGLLPALLRKRSARFKTPQYALLLSLVTTVVLLGFDFDAILAMTNAFSGAVQVVIVLSMLELRRTFPYLSRPVRLPGSLAVAAVALLPAMAVFLFSIVTTLLEWELAIVVVAFAVPGALFPIVRRRLSGQRGCC